MDTKLRTILSSIWAIDEAYAVSINPYMQELFAGKSINLQQFVSTGYAPEMVTSSAYGKSIAIIPIKDVIMREDFCGILGTESIQKLLFEYASNPQIGGVILEFDTPGGQVAFTENLAETIKVFPKPIVSYVSSCCASAGYWLASQANKVFTSVNTDRVGSIGTMIQYCKANPDSAEQPEYIQVSVYASRSTDKNRAYDEMKNGQHERIIKEVLDPINEVFVSQVQSGRSNISKETLTGKMYYSRDALRLGMIDGIKTMDEVIAYVSEQIQASPTSGIFNQNNIKMKNELFSTILGRDVNDGEILSVEDLTKVQSHIEGLNSTIAIHVTADETVTSEAVEAAVSPLNARISELESELADLKSSGASAVVTAPTNGPENMSVPGWQDPNRSYNKVAEQMGL